MVSAMNILIFLVSLKLLCLILRVRIATKLMISKTSIMYAIAIPMAMKSPFPTGRT